jgi:two-component system chemotaxis response regulator CheY
MGKTIIVVEVSKTILEVLSFSLEKADYNIFTASSGRDAIIYFDGRDIDLMITDLYMPEMDGLELVRQVKKIEKYSDIPVLFLTTESQQSKKLEAKKVGATGWVIKPFVPEKLVQSINKLLTK